MSLILETIKAHLPLKRKQTPSGWISFNAPCCDDKRQRGGIIFNTGDGVSYHCFNCGFKTSWQPGRLISQKLRKLMRLFHMSDDIISQLNLEALRLHDHAEIKKIVSLVPTFEPRVLPPESALITSYLDDIPEKLVPVLEYMSARKLYLEDYPFYWSPSPGFSNRLIIPYYYQNILVGYTARTINKNTNPRYLSEQQPGFVFNLDGQTSDRNFVIVCEGQLDAISIDGCALTGSDIHESQNWLLQQLNREIVLVPDKDKTGIKTVEQAMEYNWSVSMPDWPDGVKDINDAVVKLGRLATLWLIMKHKESYGLKIKLRLKSWIK